MTPDEKLRADLGQHLASRGLREMAEEQENKFKRLVLDDLVAVGTETPEGHYVVEFEGEDNNHLGWVLGDGRVVTSVKREKRSSTTLDPDAVEKLLPAEQYDTVFKTTLTVSGLSPKMAEAVVEALTDLGLVKDIDVDTTLDEDELLGLNYESVVSDEDLKAMYHEAKVIYALKVNYAKS